MQTYKAVTPNAEVAPEVNFDTNTTN
jgi:hypothetical protein